jgi:2-amino-4-hydroxy-6-hydroxymethyldihydropteridine diphosphokinase
MTQVYLSLGSNIAAEVNLPRSVHLLKKHVTINEISSVWETISVGTTGPNFLNAVVACEVIQTINDLKEKVLQPIENQLGRVRLANKNAPRTIDLDILIYNDLLIEKRIWELIYLAVPLAELIPDYLNPETGEKLILTAEKLKKQNWLKLRSDINLGDSVKPV